MSSAIVAILNTPQFPLDMNDQVDLLLVKSMFELGEVISISRVIGDEKTPVTTLVIDLPIWYRPLASTFIKACGQLALTARADKIHTSVVVGHYDVMTDEATASGSIDFRMFTTARYEPEESPKKTTLILEFYASDSYLLSKVSIEGTSHLEELRAKGKIKLFVPPAA